MKRSDEMKDQQERLEEKGGNIASMLKGMLIGGMIGAGIALLSAPRSGQETRDMLREKGYELKDRAVSTVDETLAKADSLAQKGTERANEVAERGQNLLNEQKANLQGTVAGVKEGLRTYKELNQSGETDTDRIA
jgi:gas vesicle protein